MTVERHGVKDNIQVTLDASIDATQTSVVLEAGEGATLDPPPFWLKAHAGGEQIDVTNVATDTLTVVRGANGTTGTPHVAGAKFDLDMVAAQATESQNEAVLLHKMIALLAGAFGSDGVFMDGTGAGWTFLKVVAQDTPDMTVKVKVGYGVVSDTGVELAAEFTTPVIVAPSSNDRIDLVQISKWNAVTVVTGVEDPSPSKPSLSADNQELASILLTTATGTIPNGIITDGRVGIG